MANKKEERTTRPSFEFYKINIRKATQTQAFREGVSLSAHDALKAVLGHTGSHLELLTEGKDGGATRYHNAVLRHDRDIVLLRLHNDKEVRLTKIDDSSAQGYGEQIEHDYPPCHIIIDNREGMEHVAIERTRKWGKTDNVKTVLEEAFNHLLKNYEWVVEISPLSLFMAFEEYHRQRTEEGVSMASVTVKVLNPAEYTNLHLPDRPKGIIRDGVDNCRRYSALNYVASMQLNTSQAMKSRAMRTLTGGLGVAFENGFDASIKYSNGAVYRNGEAPAVFSEAIIHFRDFHNGSPETDGTYRLELWLAAAYEKIAKYADDGKVRQKPKRNRKKHVS